MLQNLKTRDSVQSGRFAAASFRAETFAEAPRGSQACLKIALTGSTGLIGTALCPALEARGHQVLGLTRAAVPPPKMRTWDPDEGVIDGSLFENMDAVIHLAGEGIATRRWTPQVKQRILRSRIRTTTLLAEKLAALKRPPRTLISASAIGFYGDRGSETLDEQAMPGSGFLPDVCKQWEQATLPAERAGIRVVHARIGIVLTPRGGALKPMLPPFKWGVGGVIGSGAQFWSWIALGDLVAALIHCLETQSLEGPVNLVAPHAVNNRDFTRALGRVLRRPVFLPMPAFGARVLLGEMADALILSSARVVPARLLESGFEFSHPELEPALKSLLG